MLTLRALSMEKVVTEDLSPHFYPQTLLDEIQNLKKFYNIGLNQQYCRKKQQLLDVRWSQDDIDAQLQLTMITNRCKYLRRACTKQRDEDLVLTNV